jgi:peptidoglycan hydrolase-like protein with peptidoglycan-binding domain
VSTCKVTPEPTPVSRTSRQVSNSRRLSGRVVSSQHSNKATRGRLRTRKKRRVAATRSETHNPTRRSVDLTPESSRTLNGQVRRPAAKRRAEQNSVQAALRNNSLLTDELGPAKAGLVCHSMRQSMGTLLLRYITMITILLSVFPAVAEGITADAVNNAEFGKTHAQAGKVNATIVKAQILLDRARYSPREIDGKRGENFRKALRGFAHANGLTPNEELTPEIWVQLSASDSEPVITTYRITKRDVEGPFLQKLPIKMDDMKGLKALSYSSASELLAERFHMSEDLLRSLNGGKPTYEEGMEIRVANVKRTGERPLGATIEVDKSRQLVSVSERTRRSSRCTRPRSAAMRSRLRVEH